MSPNPKSTNVASPSPSPGAAVPKRRRWRWYLAAAAAFFCVLPVGLYWVMNWRSANAAALAKEETDRLDPGWRLADIEAARITLDPAENAAEQIAKVLALGVPNSILHRRENEAVFDQLDAPYELHPFQRELLREAYQDAEEARQEARRLKDLPKGRHPLKISADFISTTLTSQQNTRRVFELLQHDAWLRADGGDDVGALESCRAGLNAARSLGDEPILISLLIRIAGDHIALLTLERVLAQTKRPTDASLAPVQALLEQEIADVQRHWLQALRGERGGQEQLTQALIDGRLRVSHLLGAGLGQGSPALLERIGDYFPGLITRDYPALLRCMNEAVEIGKLPLEQQTERLRLWEQGVRNSAPLVRSLAPALNKVTQAHLRDQAFLRSALVAVAAERFRLRENRWPVSTADLEKSGLLPQTPLDPFDGAPMRWRTWADGCVAYSVGLDQADNGGKLNRQQPLEPGVDIGFLLWNVERRRQPARAPALDREMAP